MSNGLWDLDALADNEPQARFASCKSLVVLLFWNVSRPKREGFVDPQFKLLSVGSIWLDPNIMTYANEWAGTSGTI